MPTAPNRRAYHHGNLREALIEAAVACVAEAGLEGMSLREVARLAGVTHQAPYRHFADRASLLAAAAEDGHQRLQASLRRALDGAGSDPEARLEALVIAYVRFATDESVRFHIMFSSELSDKSPFPSLQREADTTLGILTDCVSEAQQAQRVAPGALVDYAAVLWAFAHGLATFFVDGHLRRRGFSKEKADAIVTRLLAILRDGMRPRR